MELSRVLGFLIIVYALTRFLPQRRRLSASILITLLFLFGFSYQSSLKDIIEFLNSDRTVIYAQMVQYLALVYAVQMAISSKALKVSEAAIEYSQLMEFLKVVKESIMLIPKNGKLMGLITTLSLLLPSILLSLFSLLYHYLLNRVANSLANNSSLIILQFAPPLLIHMAFLLCCSVIFQLSATATILVSANAYTDRNQLSLPSLFSRMKTTWRRELRNSFSRSRNPTHLELVLGAIRSVTYLAATVNITSPILLVFFMDHESAAGPLSSIVSVVEKSSDGGEAHEKAQRLVEVEGRRLQGLVHKLLFLMALVYSLMVMAGDSGAQFDLKRGLLLLNSLSVGRILWYVMHTLLYFRYDREIGKQS